MVPNGSSPQQASQFGALLRSLREQAGLTQEQLAERAGLGTRTIRYLEHGRVRPQPRTVRLLAGALGLDGAGWARLGVAARPAGGGRPAPDAASAGAVVPAQLPTDVAGFTGRVESLAQLDALVLDGRDGQEDGGRPLAVVITAIAGTAGVGKTALTVHWAHRVADRFPDGQLYVDLHGWALDAPLSPPQALAHLLGALGVDADKVPVELDQAAGLYRSLLARRRALVVLDNARDAEQVRPLLPGGPGCVVLVTSRDGLAGLVASHGARRLVLDVLTRREAVSLLSHILGSGRVDAEPGAAEGLAEACGLLPLALRIAAANLAGQPAQPIAGYLARLRAGDRLAELAVDGDPEAAVRAAFDCSYAALGPDAQRLFRLLGLVPGAGFTAEAAAALAAVAPGQASRLLERLAGAHLVERRGPGRFGFHDLLRLYARERAARGEGERERQAALGRLLGCYLHTADQADRLLYPHMLRQPVPPVATALPLARFEERAAALAWLDAERPNLMAAVQHAAAHGPRKLACLLANALRGWFWEHRHMVDWLAVAGAALRAAEAEGDLFEQATAQRNLGAANYCLGDHAQAVEHHSSALALARRAGWVDGEGAALSNLAMAHYGLGQLQQAANHCAQALALHRRTGFKGGQAATLANLAEVIRELGWPEQAVGHLTRALALDREVGSRGYQAATLGMLGEAYRDLGQLDDARAHLLRGLAAAGEVGDRYDEAVCLHALATVERDAGRFAPALQLGEATRLVARELGNPRLEANTLNTLGSVQLRGGSPEQAIGLHEQALELARHNHARYPEIEALLGLAAACQQQGRHLQALGHAGQARTLACTGGFRILEGCALGVMAAADIDLGHHDEAAAHARHAVSIHRETGHRLGQARALAILGHARYRTGDAGAARACWQEALSLFAGIGAPEAEEVRTLRARV